MDLGPLLVMGGVIAALLAFYWIMDRGERKR